MTSVSDLFVCKKKKKGYLSLLSHTAQMLMDLISIVTCPDSEHTFKLSILL